MEHKILLGKTIGETFPGKFKIISNKVIAYAKTFKAEGDFSAFYNAESFLKDEGYCNGSMQRDSPIGFIKEGKFGVDDSGSTIINTKYNEERYMIITKWDRLSKENIDGLDGVILSDNFRNGDVHVVFFIFPE
jgi:hypothetical protein